MQQQQQQQKPKQLTLFQAGFKKDELSRWGMPMGPGPGHTTGPPPGWPDNAPGPSSAAHQEDSEVILIDDDEDDMLLAQALDETMRCVNVKLIDMLLHRLLYNWTVHEPTYRRKALHNGPKIRIFVKLIPQHLLDISTCGFHC